jgi:hypothetical protein
MMDENATDEVLNAVFSALESAETQSGAILQLLKDKNLATDEDLAPYLLQAGNASSVRWMAARVRIRSLLASAVRNAEQELDKKVEQAVHKKDETAEKQKQPMEQKAQKQKSDQEPSQIPEPSQKRERPSSDEAQERLEQVDAGKQGDSRRQVAANSAPEKPVATDKEQPQSKQKDSDQQSNAKNAEQQDAKQPKVA